MEEQMWYEQMWYAMEEEEGSDESVSTRTDRQLLSNTYVTMILQLLQLDPWMGIPRILRELVNSGPLWSEAQILEEFGGWATFCRTLRRMEVVRGGVVRGEMNGLPITTRAPEGEPFGHTIPEQDGHIGWWAPRLGGPGPPFMFTITGGVGGILQRYPHSETYTEDYEEEDGTEGDVAMGGDPEQPTSST